VRELEQALAPASEDDACLELSERLAPLEDAFRQLAERLAALSPEKLLPPSCEANGLQELLAKIDKLELTELEEERADAKAAPSQVKELKLLAGQVSSHEEDLANVKLQSQNLTQAVEILRADVDEMRKVAAFPDHSVSPLTKARGKLDLLCAEMAELQSQMRDAGGAARDHKFHKERWSCQGDDPEGPGPRSAGLGGSPLVHAHGYAV
ncbi:unnamed protein product, partial [Effrenium voratum]